MCVEILLDRAHEGAVSAIFVGILRGHLTLAIYRSPLFSYGRSPPCSGRYPVEVPVTEIFHDINILMVSARPQFDEDISHRLVSKVVLDTALNSGRRITVGIVWPGTLKAFKEHWA